MKSSSQIPKDGYGLEKTLYGQAVRLKAKNLTTTRSTTLKITGMTSGAVWYVDLLVRNGDGPRFSPPSMTPPGGLPPDRPPPGRPPRPPRGRQEEERGGREEERDRREEERGRREEERDGREEERGRREEERGRREER